jgi:DNA-binding transcriptional LysR family regulator
MELRHIHAAIALSEELHFGRVAKRLRIAQSAVSQLIKALESELDVVLFARTKRTVRITPAGQQFVDGARRVMNELAQTKAALSAVASGESGRLAIRFVPMAGLTDLPHAITRFQRAHPALTLSVEPASTADQLEALRTGRCDIGFVPLAATRRSLEPLAFRTVTRNPLVVLVSTRHRFAGRRSLRFDDLAPEPMVFLGQAGEPQLNALFRRRCLDAGFEPNIVMEVEHTDVLLGFVAAGFAISVVPDLVEGLRLRGVTTVPLTPALHGGIVAVWHPALLSAAGGTFLAGLPPQPAAVTPRQTASRARGAPTRRPS